MLSLNVTDRTVGTSPQVNLTVRSVDPVSGDARTIFSTQDFDPTIATHLAFLYPGLSSATLGAYGANVQGIGSLVLPRKWYVTVVFVQDITDLTFSLAATFIL